jgi:hypothetical protein
MTATDIEPRSQYQYKPLGKLGRITALLTGAAGAGGFLFALASIYQFVFLHKVQTGGFAIDENLEQAADFNDQLFLVATVIYIAFFVLSGISFLIWVYRAAANVHSIRATAMTISPGWTVGWNFIPIAAFWKPYQAIKQIWQASHNISNPDSVRVPDMFSAWWFFWIATNILGNAADKITQRGVKDEDISTMKLGTALSVVDAAFFVAACYLLYKIVRDLTEVQGTIASNTASVFE